MTFIIGLEAVLAGWNSAFVLFDFYRQDFFGCLIHLALAIFLIWRSRGAGV